MKQQALENTVKILLKIIMRYHTGDMLTQEERSQVGMAQALVSPNVTSRTFITGVNK